MMQPINDISCLCTTEVPNNYCMSLVIAMLMVEFKHFQLSLSSTSSYRKLKKVFVLLRRYSSRSILRTL